MTGAVVTVKCLDGTMAEGILESITSVDGAPTITLGLAQLNKVEQKLAGSHRIKLSSVSSMTNKEGVSLKEQALAHSLRELKAAPAGAKGFATDTEISGRGSEQLQGFRQLAKWDSSHAAPPGLDDFDREARLGGGWDQFEVNRQLFGVTTSFDESLYTTPLDRSGGDFKKREAMAQRLAKEILENSAGGNVHMAEERGQAMEADYDEEDRYGAVVRGKDAEANDTVPAVQMPSKVGALRHRNSITNVNADSESLQAALSEVTHASAAVSRRLSQIHEADLSKVMSEEGRRKLAPPKETKFNVDAAEFIPSFESKPVPPPQQVHNPYPYGGGYYAGGSAGGGYYDPNAYYAANPYYGGGGAQYYEGYGYSGQHQPSGYQHQPSSYQSYRPPSNPPAGPSANADGQGAKQPPQ